MQHAQLLASEFEYHSTAARIIAVEVPTEGGSAVQIPFSVHDQARGHVTAIFAACETMQDRFLLAGQLEHHAIVEFPAFQGSTVKVSPSVHNHSGLGKRPVPTPAEAVQNGFLSATQFEYHP